MHALSCAPAPRASLADSLVDWLIAAGVRRAFGVSGGGVAALWSAAARRDSLALIHAQHEAGAVFAATEASLATGELVVVMVTTGPGLTNALTGLVAARQEGARVLLLSGLTPTARRARGATQETGPEGPLGGLYSAGAVMHLAAAVESRAQLQAMLYKIAWGMAGPGGLVAHLGLPSDVLLGLGEPLVFAPVTRAPAAVDPGTLDALAEVIARGQALAVVGRAAGAAGEALRALVDRTGLRVVSAPHGKGVLPEDHPCHLGVVGFAGQEQTLETIRRRPFEVLLLLGVQLGEAESGWSPALRPQREIVVVDAEGEPPHGGYADVPHAVIAAPARVVLEGLLARVPLARVAALSAPREVRGGERREGGPVRPSVLMEAVQQLVVEGSAATLLAESGNAFAWAIHLLRLPAPRLRVSVGWGSMGHVTAGAIGVAVGGQKAVALVGDGAMLMGNEVVTAVRHGLDVVWIVLNDHGYGMCRHGMSSQGYDVRDLDQAQVDFAALARSLGAHGVRIDDERHLDARLARALARPGPVIIDVRIDPDERPPIGSRVRNLTFHAPEAS